MQNKVKKEIVPVLVIAMAAIGITAIWLLSPLSLSEAEVIDISEIVAGPNGGIVQDGEYYVSTCAFDPKGESFCMIDTDKQNLEERLAEAAFLKGLN